ncbi:MAG: UDP-glucose 4-epimerase GalE [Planctomycetia bacterium]|nr:UDP-glucose 4-epimerase GalE [Planctomycetia bacterium]
MENKLRVLVTGGAGYIGSHAVKTLHEKGYYVAVLDNLCRGHRKAVPEDVPFFQTDLQETDRIEEILRENKIDVVMHFAAFMAVGESVQCPIEYYRNNTGGALSLLYAMKKAGVCRFIFSSTAATYGEPETTPIYEDQRQLPVNPYGWSKWMVERILKDYGKANPEFGFTALRYFNVGGSAEDGSIGEDHRPETHLLPKIIYAALGKDEKLTVFGTDYPTPDGTCIRDYVHVEDLIAAHILAMEAIKPGDQKFYNLGIGHGYSVKEMLDAAEKVLERKIPVVYGERRPGDPARLYANSDKAQKELGWKPLHTDVADMIESAWKWYKNHPNGYPD